MDWLKDSILDPWLSKPRHIFNIYRHYGPFFEDKFKYFLTNIDYQKVMVMECPSE